MALTRKLWIQVKPTAAVLERSMQKNTDTGKTYPLNRNLTEPGNMKPLN